MALDYSKAYLTPSKRKDMVRLRAERAVVMLAAVENLLPLPKNATFEELVEISQKVGGNNAYYSRIDKAIKAHPAYKKVIADLNTGELGRNYAYLKRPETTIGIVNRTYKEVKKREGIANKALDAIYKRAGNDPVKLIEEYNKVGAKNITVPLEKKIRSLPAYKEFLKYDKEGFAKGQAFAKSKDPSREFLRFKTYLNFAKELPEGTKFSDYVPLDQLVKDIGKPRIPTPRRLAGFLGGADPGAPGTRYKFFDYNQITKLLGNSIVAKDGREFFRKPTDEQVSKLRRFFKDGTYMYGDHTESVVKAIHQNPKLQKLLAAKKFPELHEFKPELEKVLKKSVTDAQAAHGTRIYSDWTKGTMFKNMGFDFKPLQSEVALGNRIYDALEGFKRNNKWAQGEY